MAKALFEQALELPPHALAGWLQQAADGDGELIETVLGLIDTDANLASDPEPATRLLGACLADEWPSGTRVGAYAIVRRLGQGGMGEVYLAHRDDGTVAQSVAIKRLRQDAAHPDLLRRFIAERRILARLEHPHIARFLDAGADEAGRPYAVMEYVQGEPITIHAESAGLDVDALLGLFIKVIDAVSHAHGQLVVHRDIKPGNVLVDAQGEPRLLDFGIAKSLLSDQEIGQDTHTTFELRCFSLRYAAPEQLRPGPVETASDVYALGALLFELLTGRPPFLLDGLSYGEAERVILEQDAAAPSKVLALAGRGARSRHVRGDLDRIVLHALRKSPRQRYPSAEALAQDLRNVLAMRPISLPAPQPWYPAARFVRRHWVPLGLGALAVLALFAGTLLFYTQSLALADQRDAALSALHRAEAVTDLMTEAFEAADPSRNRGARVSAREVLDIAALRLQSRDDLDARSAIELNGKLSEVMLSVGHKDAALEAATRAAHKAVHSDSGDLVATAGLALARAQLAHLDTAAAAKTLDALAARLDSLSFSDRRKREEALVQLSLVRVLQIAQEGRQTDAADLAEKVYTDARRSLSAGHPLARTAGAAYLERLVPLGRLDAASELADALTLTVADTATDSNGRRILSAHSRILRAQGRYPEALAIQQRLLGDTELLYGARHVDYARALSASALAAASADQPELADEYFRGAIAAFESIDPEDPDPMLAGTLSNYATFLVRRDGASEGAVQAARRAVELVDATMPEPHINRAFLRLSLGNALLASGRHDECIQTLTEADTLLAALDAGDRVALPRVQALSRLAFSALSQGDQPRARHWYDQAVAMRDDIPKDRSIDQETESILTGLERSLSGDDSSHAE